MTALDVATEDGPSYFAMLWLRGGKLRKSLMQMKEHGRLNEWLGGALSPASGACNAENHAVKATCSRLQLLCRHKAASAGPLLACRFQVHGAAETPTGFAVSNRFQDLASTTRVAFGQQLPSLCLVAAHLCARASLLPAPSGACMHLNGVSGEPRAAEALMSVPQTDTLRAHLFTCTLHATSHAWTSAFLTTGSRHVLTTGIRSRECMCAQLEACGREGEPAELPSANS